MKVVTTSGKLSGMAANKQKEVLFDGSIPVAAHNAVKKCLTETGSSKQSIASMKTQFNIILHITLSSKDAVSTCSNYHLHYLSVLILPELSDISRIMLLKA